MDRIALALIASGLALILGIVVSVMGGSAADALPAFAGMGAAIAGAAIVIGLVLLERRAFASAPARYPSVNA